MTQRTRPARRHPMETALVLQGVLAFGGIGGGACTPFEGDGTGGGATSASSSVGGAGGDASGGASQGGAGGTGGTSELGSVTMRTPLGVPLASRPVVVNDSTGAVVGEATLDAAGQAMIDIPEGGSVEVIVEDEVFAALRLPEDSDVVFTYLDGISDNAPVNLQITLTPVMGLPEIGLSCAGRVATQMGYVGCKDKPTFDAFAALYQNTMLIHAGWAFDLPIVAPPATTINMSTAGLSTVGANFTGVPAGVDGETRILGFRDGVKLFNKSFLAAFTGQPSVTYNIGFAKDAFDAFTVAQSVSLEGGDTILTRMHKVTSLPANVSLSATELGSAVLTAPTIPAPTSYPFTIAGTNGDLLLLRIVRIDAIGGGPEGGWNVFTDPSHGPSVDLPRLPPAHAALEFDGTNGGTSIDSQLIDVDGATDFAGAVTRGFRLSHFYLDVLEPPLADGYVAHQADFSF